MKAITPVKPTKLTICIATCKRAAYLTVLLNKISENIIPDTVIVKITIADNDPDESAKAVIGNIIDNYRFPIAYGVVKQRGIPFTRNKAVSMADKDSDFIVFIDDDEYPDKHWLKELLETQEKTNADLVQGPAFPEFIDSPPAWITKGKFFVFPFFNYETGTVHSYRSVATNNLLVKYSILMLLNGPFDETMGLIGCDDNALGINLHQLGAKMIYTKEAIVHEFIPKYRTTLKWILQRAYRTANTHWLLTPDKSLFKLIKLFTGAVARILVSSALLLPVLIIAPITGFQYAVKVLRLTYRGVAIIAGIFGKNYEEYKHAYTVPIVNT